MQYTQTNNNEEQQQSNNSSRMKDGLKDAGRKAGKEAGKALGKLVKAAFKKLIAVIGIKAFIVLIIIILIAGFFSIITEESFDAVASTFSSDNISFVSGTGTGEKNKGIIRINDAERKIEIDTTVMEEKVEKLLKNGNIEKRALNISKDNSELKKLLEAEIVTTFPDLRTRDKIGQEVPEGEMQGCIQFKRKTSEGEDKLLEYMAYNTFVSKIEEANKLQTKEEVENAYNKLKYNFTIDENKNLLLANLCVTETKTTYSDYAKEEGKEDNESYSFNIKLDKFNYQDLVKNYSMPFELPLAILMSTTNAGFAEAVADLGRNSKIIIQIQDSNTQTTETIIDNYTFEFKVEKDVTYKIEEKEEKGDWVAVRTGNQLLPVPTANINETVNNYCTEKIKTTTNSISLSIIDVETWIAKYNVGYSVISTEENDPPNTFTDETEIDCGEVSNDFHGYSSRVTYTLPEQSTIEEKTTETDTEKNTEKNTTSSKTVKKERRSVLEREETKIYKKQKSQSKEYAVNEIKTQYIKVSQEGKEIPEKFLSLLKVDPSTGVFDLENNYKNTKLIAYSPSKGSKKISPDDNLQSNKLMLYELLESNSKTVNLVETIKYLLKLYDGKTTVDVSRYALYEPTSFNKIVTSYAGLSFEEKVWYTFRREGYSEEATAGAMGNFMKESSIRSNNLQNSFESSLGMTDEEYTQKVNSREYTKEQFINDEAGYGLAQWTFSTRKEALYNFAYEKGVGIDNEDMQIEFVLKDCNTYGYGKEYSSAKEAADAFHNLVESSADKDLTQRELYAQQIYEKYKGKSMPRASALINASKTEKIKFLYDGKDVPQALTREQLKNDFINPYLVSVEVPITTKEGVKTTTTIQIHKLLAQDVIDVLQLAQDSGFKVYDVSAYQGIREINTDNGANKYSLHSVGIAIDINVNENYSIKDGEVRAGEFWNPNTSEYSIPEDGILVNAFKEIGWDWGGNFSSTYHDYMHFQYIGGAFAEIK